MKNVAMGVIWMSQDAEIIFWTINPPEVVVYPAKVSKSGNQNGLKRRVEGQVMQMPLVGKYLLIDPGFSPHMQAPCISLTFHLSNGNQTSQRKNSMIKGKIT